MISNYLMHIGVVFFYIYILKPLNFFLDSCFHDDTVVSHDDTIVFHDDTIVCHDDTIVFYDDTVLFNISINFN